MTTEILTVEEPGITFIKKKHELQATLKKIEKGSADAVELLIAAMADEKLDQKFRIQVAMDFLDLQAKFSDIISKDNIARQVAQVKLGGPQPLNLVGKDKESTIPVLNFATITNV